MEEAFLLVPVERDLGGVQIQDHPRRLGLVALHAQRHLSRVTYCTWEIRTFAHWRFWVRESFRVGERRSGGSGATGATRGPEPQRAFGQGGV